MRKIFKIAILDRVNSKISPGGDTVQIRETADFLKSMGHDVKIFNELYPDLNGYDFACLFNLTRYSDVIINTIACKKYGIKYILFPVYWNLDIIKVPPYNLKSFIKNNIPIEVIFRLRYLKARFNGRYTDFIHEYNYLLMNEKKGRQYILENAYAICPNSIAEQRHLQDNFKIANDNFNIVYNGIKKNLYKKAIHKDRNKNIVCVGGIGPRKNQVTLAKAASLADLKVQLIGKAQSQDMDYYKELKKYSKNIEFSGWKNNDEVLEILSFSKIHIQPSFIETPGISSMEAYALGCNVIVSDVEPVKEYFGDRAIYINPYSAETVKNALLNVYEDSYVLDIQRIKEFNERFCWENVLKSLCNIF